MREIKCRIQRTNGVWEYFTLLKDAFKLSDVYFHQESYNMETFTESTLLFDKNGKEIYEGDIIRRPFQTKMLYETTIVKWESFLEGFVTKGEEWEIVGNIYEHSHLLNK